jgi:integrase
MPVENRGTDRNPRWRYAFTIRGVRYRAAVPEARTKFEALQAELEAKKAVFEGRYGRPTGGHDFIKFIDEVYLPWSKANKRSWYDDELFTNLLREHKLFKGKTFAQLSPMLIEKFKKERRESDTKRGGKRSPATVNRELEILSRIFSLAITAKVTSTNPCFEVNKLQINNKRNRYLLDEEEPRLLAQCRDERAHLYRMIIVAVGTGMRKGDQLRLRWTKVDFQRNVIYVPNQKTGHDYTVPMNKDVRNVMLQLKKEAAKDAEFVFVNPRTNQPYTDIKKAFAWACDKAKITDLHWHDLRHTFGTRLGEAGFSDSTIAELMGHTSVSTTRRYTHGTENAKKAAVEAARMGARNSRPKYAPKAKQPALRLAVNS